MATRSVRESLVVQALSKLDSPQTRHEWANRAPASHLTCQQSHGAPAKRYVAWEYQWVQSNRVFTIFCVGPLVSV